MVPQGAEVLLWMNFLVPNGDEGRILILFTRQDRVRHTSQVVVKSAVRYRTWKKIPTDRVGEWTVTILHELGDNQMTAGRVEGARGPQGRWLRYHAARRLGPVDS